MDESLEKLSKEVFAQFGLAYYHSECFYRELCNAYVLVTFQSAAAITRPRIEEKMVYAFSLTLGQVVDELKTFFPQSLFLKVNEGVGKRNFLAHHFWFERAHLMFSVAGLKSMIEEMIGLSTFFSAIDEEVSNYFKPKLKDFGFTDDLEKSALIEIIAGKPWEPLLCKRKLKKQERIVRAWEFVLPDGTLPLVFETDDGCFWQLCDVGLGWTQHETTGKEWRLNDKIQPNLPTTINPRPKNSAPWNYEFTLSNNIIFWIKPGGRERSFKWGLKKKPKDGFL